MENDKELELSDAESLELWAKIVIERWETRIEKLNIRHTETLLKSFDHQISRDANGNYQKVRFTFAYYGRFVDMGVGKGVPAKDVVMSNRQPKPWYSKTFIKECNTLSRIMAERWGQVAANSFKIIENKKVVR